MNIIYLCGGLGNQLFQYAFGRTQRSNKIEVKYYKGWYDTAPKNRSYVLDKFNTNVRIGEIKRMKIFREPKYDKSLTRLDGYIFQGYWQYFNYFESIMPIIKNEFVVKEQFYTPEFLVLRSEISSCNSVAVHVRRGDYIGNSNWTIQPLEYYTKALSYLKICRDIDRVYVFSDDISWCKENFKDVTFVHLENYLDFELMKCCKHFILANSTFGFFPALLNDNPNKQVYCPESWLGYKHKDNGNHYPEDWIRL